MINWLDFKNCIIANINGSIRPVILVSTLEDSKNKIPYFVYRDIIDGTEHILFDDVKINGIFHYMDEEERNRFVRDDFYPDERLNIIARAIKEEQDKFNNEYEMIIKKILKF